MSQLLVKRRTTVNPSLPTAISAPSRQLGRLRESCRRARIWAVADRVLRLLTGLSAGVLAGHWWAMTEVRRPVTAAARQPVSGERAVGYGVSGRIALVPEFQPLAAGGIWRVTLAGESVGRLARRDEQDYSSGVAGWQLLQLDDITDAQLETYEAHLLDAG